MTPFLQVPQVFFKDRTMASVLEGPLLLGFYLAPGKHFLNEGMQAAYVSEVHTLLRVFLFFCIVYNCKTTTS